MIADATWDWEFAGSLLPDMLSGLETTVLVVLCASPVAFIGGFVWTLLSRPHNRLMRAPATLVVQFLRGTPLLVQLYFAYYVLPKYGVVFSAFITGVAVLGLHYSAYASEVYRGAVDSIPVGQWEAARALSLSTVRTWQAVILPPAIRRSVPALATYMIAMYKETALLFVIGLPVLLFKARTAGSSTFRFTEPYTIVGILYFVISYSSALLLRRLEARDAGRG